MITKVSSYKAEFISNVKVSSKVYKASIKLITPDSIEFLPGQFASIKVAASARRSYSISSNPADKSIIETYVDITPGGPGSQFFAAAQVGTPVEFLAPLGVFFYKQTGAGPAVFLATGTGITPFLSMIYDQLITAKSAREIHLFWGLRYEEDVFLKSELDQLQLNYPNFHYTLCLSRPTENWQGDKGHCTDQLTAKWDSITNAQSGDYFMCGAGTMLDDAKRILAEKQVAVESIHYEKFY